MLTIVESVIETFPEFPIPPPPPRLAELLLSVELEMVSVPVFSIPPPRARAELPVIVELERVSAPLLLMPPPPL